MLPLPVKLREGMLAVVRADSEALRSAMEEKEEENGVEQVIGMWAVQLLVSAWTSSSTRRCWPVTHWLGSGWTREACDRAAERLTEE